MKGSDDGILHEGLSSTLKEHDVSETGCFPFSDEMVGRRLLTVLCLVYLFVRKMRGACSMD
jgi:hypothetical protein